MVAVAYFITGQTALLLAIPPSNAAAIWPAAGVALAAVIISGPRVLLGILLAGILVQTDSFLDPSTTEKFMSSLFIGTIISTGAVIQAWLGARLVQGVFKKDAALLNERSVIMFSLLVGPVACLISASVGILTLWFQGILTLSDLPLAWSTWWIGDTIGVLVFSPIILCFFGNPRHVWKQRIFSVAIPLFILCTITVLAFKFSYQHEMNYVKQTFENNTIRFNNELMNSFNKHLDLTEDLKEYFDNSVEVTKEEFPRYVRSKLSRHSEIKALEWIPKVEHKDREFFEARTGTQIKIPDSKGAMISSPVRDVYFPIEYLEPFIGNENALGFDILNNPVAVKAVEAACSSGNVAVTDATKLIQGKATETGIVFYAPVYKKNEQLAGHENCDALLGIVASVFRLENEIHNIHKRLPDLKVLVSIKNNTQMFYSDVAEKGDIHKIPNQFQFERRYKIPMANQQWELIFSPDIGFISLYSSWSIWLVIVGGALICGLSGTFLLMLTGRTLQTEEKVRQRTEALNVEVKEREDVAALLALENECLGMLAQEDSIPHILDTVTVYIEKMVPGAMSSIFLLDPSGRYLEYGSAPSLPADYMAALDGVGIGPNASSSRTAAYLNKQIIVTDIANDPLWKDYRDFALKYGLRACWSTPITVANEKVLGTFALYFDTPREPSAKIIDLTYRMANVIAIAILRKKTEEKLTYHATHDALTGLVNRREFEQRTVRLLESAKLSQETHALCFMDLDQFKVINDNCGHTAGDELLRQVTLELQKVVRKQDTLARLGGDEFGILMDNCTLEQAHRVATLLLETVQKYQFFWQGQSFRVGVSIGMVAITDALCDLSELMKEADAACYMAKDGGRNRIHVYHPDDIEIAQRHGEMQWVSRINHALRENRFCLYAQTIEPLNGGSEKHYELLLRMIDEKGDTILPGAFLPAAERYNLISEIDYWVIQQAIELLAENPEFLRKINFISINLSGQSLANHTILNFIISQLDASGINGEKICFEVTETAAISNLNMAIKFISTLKDKGCQFALDDFGSGLSSFAYLKNLPVDYLKIDGMFVKGIVDDPIDRAMVKSINEIGQIMGMKTIAEFVENNEIRDMLRESEVDYAQGYGVAKPKPFYDILTQNLNE
ncbi:MAG: EAL domain-containing protein [Gammaproteobacteria bacterium]